MNLVLGYYLTRKLKRKKNSQKLKETNTKGREGYNFYALSLMNRVPYRTVPVRNNQQ
jgi:hypothetical protein